MGYQAQIRGAWNRLDPVAGETRIFRWRPNNVYLNLLKTILKPLKLTGLDKISISVKVHGGGVKGQVDGVKHGIARALLKVDENFRTT